MEKRGGAHETVEQMRKRIEERDRMIADMREEKLSIKDIAERLHCSRAVVIRGVTTDKIMRRCREQLRSASAASG